MRGGTHLLPLGLHLLDGLALHLDDLQGAAQKHHETECFPSFLRSPQSRRTHPTLSPSMIAEVRLDATKRKVCVSAFRSQSGSKPEPTTVFMPSSRSRQSNTLRNRKYVLIEPSEHICHNLQAQVPFQRQRRKKGGRKEERFRHTQRDVFKDCGRHVSAARFAELRAFGEPGSRACDATHEYRCLRFDQRDRRACAPTRVARPHTRHKERAH